MMKQKLGFLKTIYFINLINILLLSIFLASCQEQDVISNIRSISGYGFLETSIVNSNGELSNGRYKNLNIKSSDFITVKLKNTGLDITKIRLPEYLPSPLYYENQDEGHLQLDNLRSIEFMNIIDKQFKKSEADNNLNSSFLQKIYRINCLYIYLKSVIP